MPFGLFGTIWSYLSLHEIGVRTKARIDWRGNITFAVGLIGLLAGITYGIQPYGGHTMGWTNPWVLTGLIGGVALLVAFCVIETRVTQPMFDLQLFRIRAFAAGNLASLLASIARGGLQFMLIIWLQGIWLPLHGYSYEDTPLWAGIYLLPLTVGFLVSGPLSGWLSDRTARAPSPPAVCCSSAAAFVGLLLLPTNFSYRAFAAADLPERRRVGAVRRAEHDGDHEQRPGAPARRRLRHARHLPELRLRPVDRRVLLADDRRTGHHPADDAQQRPHRSGRARAIAHQVGPLPPVGSLFAAFLGYNPIRHCSGRPGAGPPAGGPRRHADRQEVLPAADLPAVPPRPGDRLHHGDDRTLDRRRRVCCAAAGTCTRNMVWRARPARRHHRGRAGGHRPVLTAATPTGAATTTRAATTTLAGCAGSGWTRRCRRWASPTRPSGW